MKKKHIKIGNKIKIDITISILVILVVTGLYYFGFFDSLNIPFFNSTTNKPSWGNVTNFLYQVEDQYVLDKTQTYGIHSEVRYFDNTQFPIHDLILIATQPDKVNGDYNIPFELETGSYRFSITASGPINANICTNNDNDCVVYYEYVNTPLKGGTIFVESKYHPAGTWWLHVVNNNNNVKYIILSLNKDSDIEKIY